MSLAAPVVSSASEPLSRREPPVPFLDLKAQYATLRVEILEALHEIAESTAYVLGPKVIAFEEAFAAFVGAKHCVGVNSGTSALHLALIAAGVRPGEDRKS